MPNTITTEGENLIILRYEGNQTAETARELHRRLEEVIQTVHASGKGAHVLVDVSMLGVHDSGSHMATIEALKKLQFEKMAIVGADDYVKHIGNFIVKAAGKTDLIHYVASKDEALTWFATNGTIKPQQIMTRKILVLVSDSTVQQQYREIFSTAGYETLSADTVGAATTILAVSTPDLIVLDLMLTGGKNGFDFLEGLKRSTTQASIPVLVCTDLTDQSTMAMSIGADAYLLKKDITPVLLLETVQKLLEKK